MKKTLLLLVAAISLLACNPKDKKAGVTGNTDTGVKMNPDDVAKAQTDSANFTTIEWLDSTVKNLGDLKKDQQVEVTFRFRNSGNKVLVFESVTAGCGCTVVDKPEKPFEPGEEGVIKASYNGSGNGVISKNVTAIANTKPERAHNLTFTGNVQ